MNLIQTENTIAKRLIIKGLVQGVGFRPFVYHLAKKYQLNGFVNNTNYGVYVEIVGVIKEIANFINDLKNHAPEASQIKEIQTQEISSGHYNDFVIESSERGLQGITNISPDIAVCDQCLLEMKNQPHRLDYPFINCTQCGPRFSIINRLPYDRISSSMSEFKMCTTCNAEYHDIYNRRYHAQPTACNHCGPKYSCVHVNQEIYEFDNIIRYITDELIAGNVIAVKGLGGYNLMCDALNKKAVLFLRKIKQRDAKPFAVMFANLASLKKYAFINKAEEEQLLSWRKPIVILQSKNILPAEVGNQFNTVGAMLPYLSFQYLLFEHFQRPLVCTSGNTSAEPIIIRTKDALSAFRPHNIAIVMHNREIVNRTDDSVVKVVSNHPRIVRRSRGYVPEPLYANTTMPQIFGAGAELTSHFAISREDMVIPSQFIGDLQNAETLEFYQEAFQRYCKMYHFQPEYVAHDLHPDYLATKFAQELHAPAIEVQHHHAHIASCLFENQRTEKTIGICFDGTGLGMDGNIWGSEFMVADLTSFDRMYSFGFVNLPGGDKASSEPWKSAIAFLMNALSEEDIIFNLPSFRQIDKNILKMVVQAQKKGINTFKTCGMGRLFDAVAAITGVCMHPNFHAEAPMRLENIVNPSIDSYYPFEIEDNQIKTNVLFSGIINDIQHSIPPDVISAKFHNGIIRTSLEVAKKIKNETGIKHVALSGGVFQNAYLLSKLEERLANNGFVVLPHRQLPYNDGNIAIGQIAIANENVK